MSYTNANKRFAGKDIAVYSPERKHGGRYFNSTVSPVLTNSKVYQSVVEALRNNAYKYKDSEGVTRRLKVEPVPGAKDTYRIAKDGTQSAKGTPKLAINAPSPTRSEGARISTAPDVDLELSAEKYQNINDKNKQAHHLKGVKENADAMASRTEDGKKRVMDRLNAEGFFTGDDRRQYVALTGNKMYAADGSAFLTGALDEHQGGVHKNDTVSNAVYRELMPSAEQFSTMSDDEVANNLLMAGYAERLDIQNIKGISPSAITKTEENLRIATAKAIAQRFIIESTPLQTNSTLMP